MQTTKSLFQSTLPYAVTFALMLHAGQSLANFTCGPHMKTYSVTALDGRQGAGVRCVLFVVGTIDLFAWYGEGFWGRQRPTVFPSRSFYRHVGEGGSRGIASAADIYGNGEHTNAAFYGSLRITYTNIDRIEVRGAWNEVWTLEPDNIHHGYTRPPELRRIQVCGKNFIQYEAIDRPSSTGNKSGFGVRCLTKQQRGVENGFVRRTWYGEGQWNGIQYAHLGSLYAAADICERSLFGFCGKTDRPVEFAYYGATPQIPSRYIKVQGPWREDWVLNDINPCCAIPAPAPPVVAPLVIR